MARIRGNGNREYRSMRIIGKAQGMDYNDLYRYDPYPTAYNSTVQGKKLNRRINGRSQGVCGSCQSRRRR